MAKETRKPDDDNAYHDGESDAQEMRPPSMEYLKSCTPHQQKAYLHGYMDFQQGEITVVYGRWGEAHELLEHLAPAEARRKVLALLDEISPLLTSSGAESTIRHAARKFPK